MDKGSERRILIVDDNPYFRQLLKKTFEAHGCKVAGSARGIQEATTLYQSLKPDFVTLDLMMDHEHGFRTLMALRRLDPQARVIIVSSDPHPLTMEQANNLGASGYVVKPAKWEALKDAMDAAEKK